MTSPTFAQMLAAWQEQCGRMDLPWQRFRTPYERWLSEVMLQQTQVETVIPYYERFLKTFPTVESLAAAQEDEVMKLWAGLGYYSRGRNLHRAAKMVVNDLKGLFPDTAAGLAELPGVGPSTAAAVAAFTSGEAREPMIDGNVKRVLARIHAVPGRVGEKAFEKLLEAAARRELPGSDIIAPYTQGLMDLGSLVCRRKAPNCPACPVQRFCRAHAEGTPEVYPQPKTARPKTERWLVLVFASTAEGLWFAPVEGRIWKGLQAPIVLERKEADWLKRPELPQGFREPVALGESRVHELTHQRLHLRALFCRNADAFALRSAGLHPAGLHPERWPGLPAPVLEYAEELIKRQSV